MQSNDRFWTRLGLALFALSLVYGMLRLTATYFAFAYTMNVKVLWRVFGPGDIYSWNNLVLPSVLTHVVTLIPALLVGVLTYSSFAPTRRRANWTILSVVIIGSMGMALLARAEDDRARSAHRSLGPEMSGLLWLFLVSSTALLLWALRKGAVRSSVDSKSK